MELLAKACVPTTHRTAHGVSDGVRQALEAVTTKLLPEKVGALTISTTQATNAILEGDVEDVALLKIYDGWLSWLGCRLTGVRAVDLGKGRTIGVSSYLIRAGDEEGLQQVFNQLGTKRSVVIASPFSVDRPESEEAVKAKAQEGGFLATATSDLSKLYGFKPRIRTACLNASILPKMEATLSFTDEALGTLPFDAPVFLMRSDGGSLFLEDARRQPIKTILSGPAAGLAGALTFAKAYQGVFVEVGGTSTDISFVTDGAPRLAKARVGGHLLHLRTLDIETVGVAGGSLPRFQRGKIEDVGPRSAHIAGLAYSCFSRVTDKMRPFFFAPLPSDPNDYLAFGKERPTTAVTPTCCANFLHYKRTGAFLFPASETFPAFFERAAAALGAEPVAFAQAVLEKATAKLLPVVESRKPFVHEIIGGGGGAPVYLDRLAAKTGLAPRMSPHSEVISAIGAALALTEERVERQVAHINEATLERLKQEAAAPLIARGIPAETITYRWESDTVRKKVAMIASGSLLRRRESLPCAGAAQRRGETRGAGKIEVKAEGDLISVRDARGSLIARAKRQDVVQLAREEWEPRLKAELNLRAAYGDAGRLLPEVLLIAGAKLQRIPSTDEQVMMEMAAAALKHLDSTPACICVFNPR